jgi:hypothetical protein
VRHCGNIKFNNKKNAAENAKIVAVYAASGPALIVHQ